MNKKIEQIINISWVSFKNKVALRLLDPENEKMMQLQLAQTIQTLAPLFEYEPDESIKVILEKAVIIERESSKRIIDIVILHKLRNTKTYYPVELKCFRKYTRDNSGKLRGAQNLGMYDYWEDIENIELYTNLPDFSFGTQLTMTDDEYYVKGKHNGPQVKIYSTNNKREQITGVLEKKVANRLGKIELRGIYSMKSWEKIMDFYFIKQNSMTI